MKTAHFIISLLVFTNRISIWLYLIQLFHKQYNDRRAGARALYPAHVFLDMLMSESLLLIQ